MLLINFAMALQGQMDMMIIPAVVMLRTSAIFCKIVITQKLEDCVEFNVEPDFETTELVYTDPTKLHAFCAAVFRPGRRHSTSFPSGGLQTVTFSTELTYGDVIPFAIGDRFFHTSCNLLIIKFFG